ncbi:hypothetical protein BSKO_05563 [Bryopsis sp. KO-2023]|nr:hypothetical protein BSKO_05563 [Bryopsis sp. KO-2023]
MMFRGLVCLLFLLVGAVGSRPMREGGLLDLPAGTTAARKLLQDEIELPTGYCFSALAFLISKGADVEASSEETGETPLIIAGRIGYLEAVSELIARGAEVNAKDDTGTTALILAAAGEGNWFLILALIDAGADVNAQNDLGISALHNAAVYGHMSSVEPLLSRGADASAVSADGTTPQQAVCSCLIEEEDSCNFECKERPDKIRAALD